MERFGNVSQDDIQKIMDKSKNKNATKAIATWMNVYHTWVKHRRSAWNRKSRTQKTWQNFTKFILQNNKTDKHSILKLREWSLMFFVCLFFFFYNSDLQLETKNKPKTYNSAPISMLCDVGGKLNVKNTKI